MMKWMSALILAFSTSMALANCQVHVPVKEFNYAGLVINFDFYSVFEARGYKEVKNVGEADYELKLSDQEVEGTFHKAKIRYELLDLRSSKTVLSIEKDKVCFTQYCGISDYRSVWVKGYKELQKKFPKCQ